WLLSSAGGDATRLTDGSLPVWSPDGRRLAFLSDREVPGQAQPYVLGLDGGDTVRAARLEGSAESVAWSADGRRLLVLAGDGGLYGLDFSARPVMWASPAADPEVIGTRDAWRRLLEVDLGSGDIQEVGPGQQSVWEVDWDGEGTAVAIVSE